LLDEAQQRSSWADRLERERPGSGRAARLGWRSGGVTRGAQGLAIDLDRPAEAGRGGLGQRDLYLVA
jgi:hypothetical protein